MLYLYGFSLIVGGGLFALSFIGADDLEHHFDHGAEGIGHNPVQWLSLRSLMYFLFVFGGVGGVLSLAWPSVTWPLIAGIATAAAVGVGALVNAVFGYLRRTESGNRTGDDSFVGLPARMSLPFGSAGTGKIQVTRGDRNFELLARPFGDSPVEPRSWSNVVIVEIVRGVALVSPLDTNALNSPDTQ